MKTILSHLKMCKIVEVHLVIPFWGIYLYIIKKKKDGCLHEIEKQRIKLSQGSEEA